MHLFGQATTAVFIHPGRVVVMHIPSLDTDDGRAWDEAVRHLYGQGFRPVDWPTVIGSGEESLFLYECERIGECDEATVA
jgi:hypothetical protein